MGFRNALSVLSAFTRPTSNLQSVLAYLWPNPATAYNFGRWGH